MTCGSYGCQSRRALINEYTGHRVQSRSSEIGGGRVKEQQIFYPSFILLYFQNQAFIKYAVLSITFEYLSVL